MALRCDVWIRAADSHKPEERSARIHPLYICNDLFLGICFSRFYFLQSEEEESAPRTYLRRLFEFGGHISATGVHRRPHFKSRGRLSIT